MSRLTTQFGRFQLQEIFAQLSSALLLTDVDGVLQDRNERAATLLDGVLEKGEVLYGLMTDEMERGRVHKQARAAMQGKANSCPASRPPCAVPMARSASSASASMPSRSPDNPWPCCGSWSLLP